VFFIWFCLVARGDLLRWPTKNGTSYQWFKRLWFYSLLIWFRINRIQLKIEIKSIDFDFVYHFSVVGFCFFCVYNAICLLLFVSNSLFSYPKRSISIEKTQPSYIVLSKNWNLNVEIDWIDCLLLFQSEIYNC
jgi:hypothetical protein